MPDASATDARVEAFIAKWLGTRGGAERSNFPGFVHGLTDILGVDQPGVAPSAFSANTSLKARSPRARSARPSTAARSISTSAAASSWRPSSRS